MLVDTVDSSLLQPIDSIVSDIQTRHELTPVLVFPAERSIVIPSITHPSMQFELHISAEYDVLTAYFNPTLHNN